MASMKDLEARLEALETRTARLEGLTGHGTPEEGEQDQEAQDRAILTRTVTTHAEALAYEDALARMTERGLSGPDWTRDEADEGDESAPPVASPEE